MDRGGGAPPWGAFAVGVAAGIGVSVAAWRLYSITHDGWTRAPPKSSKGNAIDDVGGGGDGIGMGKRLLDDEVLREQLTRNIQFFGENVQVKLADSFVVVVGLGVRSRAQLASRSAARSANSMDVLTIPQLLQGVGSHAAHFLLRSGIGRLRLVDFDQVTLSSLNRHALATREDVGVSKSACLARHFEAICPECALEPLVRMFDAASADEILGPSVSSAGRGASSQQPDFVIDAIDNIDTKVRLLAECKRRGIGVLCVCGAGGKADPTRLKIADIAESTVDPLGRAVRYQLRKLHASEFGKDPAIPALFSTEVPRCGLVPFESSQTSGGKSPRDFQIVPNFRVRTIPVLGTTPAIFGMASAAYVLTHLAGRDIIPEPCFRIRPKVRLCERRGGREGVRWCERAFCEGTID